MLSVVVNSDSNLIPNQIGLFKELAAELYGTVFPANLRAVNSVEHLATVITARYQEFDNDAENGNRLQNEWALKVCTFIQQRLFGAFKLLQVPPEIRGMMDDFSQWQQHAGEADVGAWHLNNQEFAILMQKAFKAAITSIFTHILMSERISAAKWREDITKVNAEAKRLRVLNKDVKVCEILMCCVIFVCS